jgi:protein-disulfide isomerase
MSVRLRLAAAALACMVASAPLAARAEFTAAQRAEIVAIVRDALKRDPTILRDAVDAARADDAARQRQASADAIQAERASLVAASDPVAGNPRGDVTIVEFYDTRCPYCRSLEPEMARLLAADRGVRLVYKDIPILGPGSVLGARALIAAQRQGGYDGLRTVLMKPGGQPTAESVRADAERLGLDGARLQRDMDDADTQARIDGNLKLAHTLGINGTPAFVIGGELYTGAMSVAELQKVVAQARGR